MNEHKNLSDQELIDLIAKDDPVALEELYDRYSTILFTLLSKIIPEEKSAEKGLVDVFTMVWEKAVEYKNQNGGVYTWLLTLARNKAVDQLVRVRSEKESSVQYNEEYDNYYILPTLSRSIKPLDLNKAIEHKPKIENAFNNLTDAQKYVIELAYYQGYTIEEISERLKIPLVTVRSKIRTALHKLATDLPEA